MAKLYKINEIFYSLQGEGRWTGTPAVFVRMSGCNLRCPFCDTDFAASTPMTAAQIVDAVTAFGAKHTIITGGEPLLQLDATLVDALKDAGQTVHVETNGTIPSPSPRIDWITCSPKEDGVLRISPADVSEVKVVMSRDGLDPEPYAGIFPDALKYLQPCSCRNTAEVVEYIKAHPHWTLSLQTHKMIDIQ